MAATVTTESICEWIKATRNPKTHVSRRITCKDGFSMSVQANNNAYCRPRTLDTPYWTEVEIGYPSQIEPLLWEYAESAHDWTETVYPYTPVEVVAAVVEVHGGFEGCKFENKGSTIIT